jgi:hypothetical protein
MRMKCADDIWLKSTAHFLVVTRLLTAAISRSTVDRRLRTDHT